MSLPTLSRHPVSKPTVVNVSALCTSPILPQEILTQLRADEETDAPSCAYADSLHNTIIQSVSRDGIYLVTTSDPEMFALLNFIEDGHIHITGGGGGHLKKGLRALKSKSS